MSLDRSSLLNDRKLCGMVLQPTPEGLDRSSLLNDRKEIPNWKGE